MIQSMTGYSRATRRVPGGAVTVELRSTNHRYLEIGQRLPEELAACEGQAGEVIRKDIHRGRIDLSVAVQAPSITSRRVVVDEALAHAYHERLLEVKHRFGLKGQVTLEHLLTLPHLLRLTDDHIAHQTLWPVVRETLASAVRELVAMRRLEGQRLVKDIRSRLRIVRRGVTAIRTRLPKSIAQERRRLRERLRVFLGHAPAVTPAQLQEALALLKEVDIHEELVRLDSHLAHMEQTLAGQQTVGKKLDFIAQELMRETNTMGAKANDAIIARHVIDIKGAIEKIREQAQNLE